MSQFPDLTSHAAPDDEEKKRRAAAQAAQQSTNRTLTSQMGQQQAQPAGGNAGGAMPEPKLGYSTQGPESLGQSTTASLSPVKQLTSTIMGGPKAQPNATPKVDAGTPSWQLGGGMSMAPGTPGGVGGNIPGGSQSSGQLYQPGGAQGGGGRMSMDYGPGSVSGQGWGDQTAQLNLGDQLGGNEATAMYQPGGGMVPTGGMVSIAGPNLGPMVAGPNGQATHQPQPQQSAPQRDPRFCSSPLAFTPLNDNRP